MVREEVREEWMFWGGDDFEVRLSAARVTMGMLGRGPKMKKSKKEGTKEPCTKFRGARLSVSKGSLYPGFWEVPLNTEGMDTHSTKQLHEMTLGAMQCSFN